MAGRNFQVDVADDEIVVTLPNSTYAVTYYKPPKPPESPQLLARRIADRDDPRVAMTLSEFLTEAWKAANDKARGLGWIA
jgi:hypothetical protein